MVSGAHCCFRGRCFPLSAISLSYSEASPGHQVSVHLVCFWSRHMGTSRVFTWQCHLWGIGLRALFQNFSYAIWGMIGRWYPCWKVLVHFSFTHIALWPSPRGISFADPLSKSRPGHWTLIWTPAPLLSSFTRRKALCFLFLMMETSVQPTFHSTSYLMFLLTRKRILYRHNYSQWKSTLWIWLSSWVAEERAWNEYALFSQAKPLHPSKTINHYNSTVWVKNQKQNMDGGVFPPSLNTV